MKLWFVFFLLLFACSNENPNFSKEQVMIMVLKADPNAREVLPDEITGGVKCTEYAAGCQKPYTAKVLGLEMIFVEFSDAEYARAEVKRLIGYYPNKWLLDD